MSTDTVTHTKATSQVGKSEFLHYVRKTGKGPALCGIPDPGGWSFRAARSDNGTGKRYAVCPDCLLAYEMLPFGGAA